MSDSIKVQYDYIKNTRNVLLSFLEQLPKHVLHEVVPNFGFGCIINTHIHVADCYQYWLGTFGLRVEGLSFATKEEIENADVNWVRERFDKVDLIVQTFIEKYSSEWTMNISGNVKWQAEPWKTTPLWLITHAETHEFHHKGQIVTMARQLGFEPPDTDLAVIE
ncbi:DinB family protein [Bacillus suaedaesalsae]|uniref:Damage-inducible protein DinB n=1 Tax=Bacillus suaedaesalsae TaxID=2810349 RepID=A0ABS2DKL9_9BACI|nr:DinB family protein [Bacillus suaedaesalsae]MBM6618013.1 damage-inducible protein DinB [Bacillus suaedaesalsae]